MSRQSIAALFAVAVLALAGGTFVGVMVANRDSTPSTAIQTFTVTVNTDALTPDHLRLRVPSGSRLIVENESESDCFFSFGPYVQRLNVPSRGRSSMEFTAVETTNLPPDLAGEGAITMGCEGGQRTGTVELLTSTS